MTKTEINICITAHNEGILIGLTLESILQAKKFARNIGIEELILMLNLLKFLHYVQ